MLHNSFSWSVKGIDETGYVEGLGAAFGNVDFGGDRILPGAFQKTLSGRSGIPMLLYHDTRRPVGKWSELSETDDGLLVKGKISVKTRDGGEAYELVKDGALSGLSIGYDVASGGKRMAGKVRELIDLILHEVSLVTIGMNPEAGVTGVKDQDVFQRWVAGVRPQRRELEALLKDGFSVSNSEAERMANALLHDDRGGRDEIANPNDALWAAMQAAAN